MEPEKTRAQLQAELSARDEALARMEARLAALEAKPADGNAALLAAAIKELNERNPGSARSISRPEGPRPKYMPYKGKVRAKQLCHYQGLREKGVLFDVDLPALWSDDPFEPVTVNSHMEEVTDENGKVVGENEMIDSVTRRTDVPIIDARWRILENTSDVAVRAM